jgi:hypothetical protein
VCDVSSTGVSGILSRLVRFKWLCSSSSTWRKVGPIAQLEENTQIKTDFLVQVMQILLKAKLITCDDDENDLSPNSVVNLFLGYKK